MEADEETRRNVREVIVRLGHAFTNRDVDAGLSLFANDPDISFIGAGGNEPLRGRSEVHSVLAKIMGLPETFTFNWGPMEVSRAGDVSWMVTGAEIVGNLGHVLRRHPYRLTVVLEKRRGRWAILHYHGSDPAP